MHEKREIAIQDACILFDLVDLTLLEDFFLLNLEVLTTQQVIDEITNEEQWKKIEVHLKNGELTIDVFGTYENILGLFNSFSGLSFADSSVLELAERKKAIIMSSDGRLRRIATQRKLIVRGTLWIIEELYLKKHITAKIALEKLNLYLSVNERAPTKATQHLIEKLKTRI